MQVNSISSRMGSSKPNFGMQYSEEQMQVLREQVKRSAQEFVNLDDKSVRKMAVNMASEKVNDKKHRKISNAIIYSIPLAAGLAAAIKNPGSRISKLGTFASNAAGWLGGFALIDGVLAGKRKVESKMPAAQKFNKEHPVLSLLGSIAVSGLALFGGAKVFGKAYNKFMAKHGQKITAKAQPIIDKIAQKVNGSKILNKVSEFIGKTPSAIKSVAKGVINNGTWILVGTSLAHSFSHEKAKNKEAVNNYVGLKNAQNTIKAELDKLDTIEKEEIA